ncbi:MAG: dihydropteroate synthase [Bacteroidota bacterium]|jgi:dihydropteroate synthase
MSPQVNIFQENFHIRANGKILDLNSPKVMGILNLTPDSFYAGSRIKNHAKLLKEAEKMIDGGASILDLGAVSTRPGADPLSEDTELKRLLPALKLVRATFPEICISVDTFRSQVALASAECGADIINDVFAGSFDDKMLKVVASTKLPYILMHMKGIPSTMQLNPEYKNVIRDVNTFFSNRIAEAEKCGIKQIIIDPGFGFGKSLTDNYVLLKNMTKLLQLGKPILVGVSRKSMINNVLNIKPDIALNGTTVLNSLALLNGAGIIRVHDVQEAFEVVQLINFYKSV